MKRSQVYFGSENRNRAPGKRDSMWYDLIYALKIYMWTGGEVERPVGGCRGSLKEKWWMRMVAVKMERNDNVGLDIGYKGQGDVKQEWIIPNQFKPLLFQPSTRHPMKIKTCLFLFYFFWRLENSICHLFDSNSNNILWHLSHWFSVKDTESDKH